MVARSELRANIKQFKTVERWRTGNRQLSNPFRADDTRIATIHEIHNFLDASDDAVLRLEGPAGVGKTRLALESVSEPRHSGRALYALNADSPEVETFLSAVYDDQETFAIAIIDECDNARQSVLGQFAQNSNGRLKLICVGISNVLYDSPPPTLSRVYQLKPLLEPDIEAIIRESFPSIPKNFIDLSSRLSGGYVKLAMFVAETLIGSGIQSATQLIQVSEIGEFLRKFVDRDTQQSLQVLSLSARIGWEEEMQVEAKAVAKFVGLRFSKLQAATRRLREMGVVVPRGRYLYVSPDLLAVKAAAELWTERGASLINLISQFKEREPRRQLLRRLALMGEHPEVRKAVEGILSTKGLYPTIEALNDEFLSEVFRILSSAAPLAATNLLVELIIPVLKGHLLDFTIGRRNVMWALESLVRWPETSMKAASVLMKLALNETEKLSNNATKIFETFFHVFLSGSPIPLLERFVLIDELLEEDEPTRRMLAAKAANSSLEGHETRFGGDVDFLSKQPFPLEWKPKTFGDIWAPRKRALAYLERIGKGSDEAAVFARRGRLRSVYALVQQAQVEDAILVLETANPVTDDDRRLIPSACDQIDRVSDLTSEQRARVAKIRESAFGASYFDRLRRWVGRRLLGDFNPNGTSGFEVADERVVQLADEGFRQGVAPHELAWLVTPEAENVWVYGRRLGELDQAGTFFEQILEASPDDVNCLLLASYLSGKASAQTGEEREAAIDVVSKRKPSAGFGTTWRSEPTEEGAKRIIRLVSDDSVPASAMSALMYGGWVEKLPAEYAVSVVDLMVGSGAGNNAEAALGIVDHAVRGGAISLEQFGETIWRALEIIPTQSSHMYDWHWARVAELVVAVDPARLARIFLRFFESDETWLGTDAAQGVMATATKSDPAAVLGVIGPALMRNDLTGVRLGIKLRGWFGDLIPPALLVEWAREHGSEGFLTAASLVNAKGENLSISVRLLVKEAEKPDEIMSQLFASVGTGVFTGPISTHMEGQLRTLKGWAQDEEPRIRSWAKKALLYVEKSVQRQKLLEEEHDF